MPFVMDDIKPGSVITLKMHITGYYSVYVEKVLNKSEACARVSATKWKHDEDDEWLECDIELDIRPGDSVTIEG